MLKKIQLRYWLSTSMTSFFSVKRRKDLLSTRFTIKDVGPFLVFMWNKKDGTLQLHQRSFIENLLNKFGMQEYKPMLWSEVQVYPENAEFKEGERIKGCQTNERVTVNPLS